MKLVYLMCAFCFSVELGMSTILSEEEYAQIPQLYDMDDFPTCLRDNKIVCSINFGIVLPNNTSNNAWNIIQKNKYEVMQFRKDKLKRFRCLPNSFLGKEDDITKFLLAKENELLKNYSLKANIQELRCKSYQGDRLDFFDYAVLFGTIGLIATVISATMMDICLDASGAISNGPAMKFTKHFSIISNWKTLRRPPTSSNSEKLKAIQGLRVFSTVYVINGHTLLTLMIYFIKNTRFVEQAGSISQISIAVGMYIVQISFLISGWLMANSIHKYVTKAKDFTVKDIVLLAAYRYLRLFPVMIILQCWEWSNWFYIQGSLPLDFMDMQRKACNKYWWRSFFLTNNFSNGSDHCNAALWSLANDYQMFVISLCLFYIIFKYKKTLMLFVYMTGICCSIHGYGMYKHGYQNIVAFVAMKDIDVMQIFKSDEFYVMYASLFVNFGSYAIGVLFGSFYFKHKNLKIENNLRNNLIWACFTYLFPAFIIYMCTFTYSTFWAAIIGPLVKPTITFCVSVGILGLTFGLGGFIGQICESNFIQLIANWQYSVYLGHIWVVFYSKLFITKQLFYATVFNMVLIATSDVIGSYLFGLLIYLFIEKPFTNVLNDIMFSATTERVKIKQDSGK